MDAIKGERKKPNGARSAKGFGPTWCNLSIMSAGGQVLLRGRRSRGKSCTKEDEDGRIVLAQRHGFPAKNVRSVSTIRKGGLRGCWCVKDCYDEEEGGRETEGVEDGRNMAGKGGERVGGRIWGGSDAI